MKANDFKNSWELNATFEDYIGGEENSRTLLIALQVYIFHITLKKQEL